MSAAPSVSGLDSPVPNVPVAYEPSAEAPAPVPAAAPLVPQPAADIPAPEPAAASVPESAVEAPAAQAPAPVPAPEAHAPASVPHAPVPPASAPAAPEAAPAISAVPAFALANEAQGQKRKGDARDEEGHCAKKPRTASEDSKEDKAKKVTRRVFFRTGIMNPEDGGKSELCGICRKWGKFTMVWRVLKKNKRRLFQVRFRVVHVSLSLITRVVHSQRITRNH